MLSAEKLAEIRELLEKAQNPLFFFDNDIDGLASFLLLQRFRNRGKGVAIKSFPELSEDYSRKLHELKPDYIFVIDKPLIEKGFREAASQLGMPIVWIDHHPVPSYTTEPGISYFNPMNEKTPSNEPTSYLCYLATKKKEDEWIAVMGCISDWFIPEFAESFSKEYPDLLPFTQDPGRALYQTELGKIIKMLSFALMDRTTIVVQMLKNLLTLKNPRELLEFTPKTASIHQRYNQINRKYEKLVEKAREIGANKSKLLFFQYGGELSLSGAVANELLYYHKEKMIVVAYIKGARANIAIRGVGDVRQFAIKAIEGMQGSCEGHKSSLGGTVSVEDLPKFRDNLLKALGEK
jgi:single-stranded DNA-specific DHH superfamily exonuclease